MLRVYAVTQCSERHAHMGVQLHVYSTVPCTYTTHVHVQCMTPAAANPICARLLSNTLWIEMSFSSHAFSSSLPPPTLPLHSTLPQGPSLDVPPQQQQQLHHQATLSSGTEAMASEAEGGVKKKKKKTKKVRLAEMSTCQPTHTRTCTYVYVQFAIGCQNYTYAVHPA